MEKVVLAPYFSDQVLRLPERSGSGICRRPSQSVVAVYPADDGGLRGLLLPPVRLRRGVAVPQGQGKV